MPSDYRFVCVVFEIIFYDYLHRQTINILCKIGCVSHRLRRNRQLPLLFSKHCVAVGRYHSGNQVDSLICHIDSFSRTHKKNRETCPKNVNTKEAPSHIHTPALHDLRTPGRAKQRKSMKIVKIVTIY